MVDTKQKQETEFAAFVGIDWADQKHAWALQIPGHVEVEHGDLDHTPEAVEVWAGELARRFGGGSIAVALEQSRGASLFILTKYARLVLFPVHPATLYEYRKGLRPSGAKSDPVYAHASKAPSVDELLRASKKVCRCVDLSNVHSIYPRRLYEHPCNFDRGYPDCIPAKRRRTRAHSIGA